MIKLFGQLLAELNHQKIINNLLICTYPTIYYPKKRSKTSTILEIIYFSVSSINLPEYAHMSLLNLFFS